MIENSNSAGSEQELIEEFELGQQEDKEADVHRLKREKSFSGQAKLAIGRVLVWSGRKMQNLKKEDKKAYFEIITTTTSKEQQICIKPSLKIEDDYVRIVSIKPLRIKHLISELKSSILLFHDDNNPTENFDVKYDKDSFFIKMDISEYHDKCMAALTQVLDQERAEKESISPEVPA